MTNIPMKSQETSSSQVKLTIGLDAKCIAFGNNVGSDPFNVDTFMGLAD
jgi:hypothetical protein